MEAGHHAAIDEAYFEDMIANGKLDRGGVEVRRLQVTGAVPERTARHRSHPGRDHPPLDGLPRLAKTGATLARERRRRRSVRLDGRRGARAAGDRSAGGQRCRRIVRALRLSRPWSTPLREHRVRRRRLVVEDAAEKTKRVSPSRISELFTYRVNRKRQPSPLEFYQAARGKALALPTPSSWRWTGREAVHLEGVIDDDAPSVARPAVLRSLEGTGGRRTKRTTKDWIFSGRAGSHPCSVPVAWLSCWSIQAPCADPGGGCASWRRPHRVFRFRSIPSGSR